MSSNLSIKLIVGVSDFQGAEKDERFSKPFDWEEVQESVIDYAEYEERPGASFLGERTYRDDFTIDAYRVFYYSDGEYGSRQLFGVIVKELSINPLLTALAATFPQFQNDAFEEVGKDSVKSLISPLSFVGDEQQYRIGLNTFFVGWASVAMILFEWVGFRVEKEDLRLFLEWHWS